MRKTILKKTINKYDEIEIDLWGAGMAGIMPYLTVKFNSSRLGGFSCILKPGVTFGASRLEFADGPNGSTTVMLRTMHESIPELNVEILNELEYQMVNKMLLIEKGKL